MKPIVLSLVLTFVLFGRAAADVGLDAAIEDIESQWAIVHYQQNGENTDAKFKALVQRAHTLVNKFPDRSEPLIWEAIILCTYAGEAGGIEALSTIEKARDLLLKAVNLDPRALDGSAYVTLGSLYYMVPGWPISFGDTDQAERYLRSALEVNPDGIDTNFFYGDFLLSQGKFKRAIKFLNKALNAPIRPNQVLADSRLKDDVRADLQKARKKQSSGLRAFIDSFFDFQPKANDQGCVKTRC